MRTIAFDIVKGESGSVSADAVDQICAVLEEGGLVCLPCGGSYRILAELEDAGAVTRLLQAKRRTSKSPALVFVADERMLSSVVGEVPDAVHRLAASFWPGPLTVLLPPSGELPRKVTKQLATNEGRFGVRVPQDALLRAVLERLGRAVVASSANRQKRQGAGSPAQVRKNFASTVDLFVDAGDLPPQPASTVVGLDGGQPVVVRPGAVAEDAVLAAL